MSQKVAVMQAVAAQFPGLSIHVDCRRGQKHWTVRFWNKRSDVVFPAVRVPIGTSAEDIVKRMREVLAQGPLDAAARQ